jgi:hypothetical protein
MVTPLDGSDIFRAQANNIDDLYTTQSRISYNKTNLDIIRPGKFNVPYDPMFYGCIPYHPEKRSEYSGPYMTACYETCKALQDHSKQVFLQDFTIGQWRSKSAFNVVNLCFDDLHLNLNPQLRSANSRFLDLLSNKLNSEAHEFIKSLFDYYSILCRTGSDEKSYYILTAFFDAIRISYSKAAFKVNGLISSSAASGGTGLNIVLTPSAVDEFLYLHSVFMYRFFLVSNDTKFYVAYPCSEILYNESKSPDFEYHFNHYLQPSDLFLRRNISKN